MEDADKAKAVTPLVAPHDEAEASDAPRQVDTDAPVSTDEKGETVELPDLHGRID